ncbi:hypothetical protein JEY40_18745 [Bradyrhizobium japonicum]|uniref:hypothetical protein n=1 Tax=Bradyrhizobium japonicum TaxID=375 RepID=UPI00200C8082|nr:hypothetical protein [Bradyrhizobium japonicum]UQD76407.1 hypothetical protein JEY40_18745 [Bradyrhizobium japonicum]
MTHTMSAEWIYYLLLCGLLGMADQCVRALGGVKKVQGGSRDLKARSEGEAVIGWFGGA